MIDDTHDLTSDIPGDPPVTRVIVVHPQWYQKLMVMLALCYIIIGPLILWYVVNNQADPADIKFNREVFCTQEQINGRTLSNQCLKVLDLTKN